MPPVTRLGDNSTGHPCYPKRPSVGASPDTFANGIAIVRKNDPYGTHCCIRGTTLINTPTRNISVSELYKQFNNGTKLFTYSKYKEQVVKSEIVAVYETKKVNTLIRVTMENGECIELTGDHKLLLSDGVTYVRADKLQVGDEL